MRKKEDARRQWWPDLSEKLHGRYIPSLDGIRAVAVFLVIFYHFGFENINGPFGVEMFFTLSGFLITWLLIKEVDRTGNVSFKGFYKRRTLRIFPAFYAYLLFGLAVHLVRGHEVPWASVVCSALYVQNYHDAIFHTGDSYIGHSWSLAIEEQFYLLWPVVFWFFRKDLPRLTRVLVGTIVGVWIYRAILWLGLQVHQGYIYHAFEARADHLLVGCLLAVLLRRKQGTGALGILCSRWYLPLVTIVLMGLSAAQHGNFTYRYTVGYALEPILIAVFIVQMISFSRHALWGRLTENQVIRYLGRISYPLYLWQQLTLFTARRLTGEYPTVVQLLFAVLVTIAFATVSYYGVEKPFLALKGRRPPRSVPG